jgi:hypothetical protein
MGPRPVAPIESATPPRRSSARREVLLQGLVGLSVVGACGLARAAAARPERIRLTKRDAFGACPDLHFEATGFFRVHAGDRKWLVAPNGNAYLSLGVNHVQTDLFTRAPNRAFWARRFGARDPDSARWKQEAARKVADDLRSFGFNALGFHSRASVFPPGFAPYVKPLTFVEIPHHQTPGPEKFRDVFAADFARHCEEVAREQVRPRREDPHLLGYAFTDCPVFTEADAAARGDNVYGARRPALPTWPRVLRNLPGEHPGKQAYVARLRQRYRDHIEDFNRAYGTAFPDFAALTAAAAWRPESDPSNAAEREDNAAFLSDVVDRYYTTAVAAIRRHDANHLILGDKLNGNTDGADTVMPIVSRYTDVVYYQAYGSWDEQRRLVDRWAAATGKAVWNGDGGFSVPTPMMPNPYGPHCRTQAERARRLSELGANAFRHPAFVGWHVCGWMDMWKTFEGKQHKQHAGLQTVHGEAYPPVRAALARLSARMYDLALSAPLGALGGAAGATAAGP